MFDSEFALPLLQPDCCRATDQNRKVIRRLLQRVIRILSIAKLARLIAAERRGLARLADWQLVDIGLQPGEVRRENCRSYWDIPAKRLNQICPRERCD